MVYKKNINKALNIALCIISFHAFGSNNTASWTVVGAGPTGIMSVGLILDSGVPADQIVWIDPEFNVGRMGKYYQNVPGNGRVEQYIDFLNMCETFDAVESEAIDRLYNLPLDHAPALKLLIDPLMDITQYLRTKVIALQDEMIALNFQDDQWHVQTKAAHFTCDNVVLATGAHPKIMQYEGIEQIPLDQALNKATIATHLTPEDRVAVIGSGHSAILLLKYLSELPVASVVNFYKKPITYPVRMRSGIAWQEAGLKGDVAQWAKTVLEANPPHNIIRVLNTPLIGGINLSP